jgi:hypothetical protein
LPVGRQESNGPAAGKSFDWRCSGCKSVYKHNPRRCPNCREYVFVPVETQKKEQWEKYSHLSRGRRAREKAIRENSREKPKRAKIITGEAPKTMEVEMWKSTTSLLSKVWNSIRGRETLCLDEIREPVFVRATDERGRNRAYRIQFPFDDDSSDTFTVMEFSLVSYEKGVRKLRKIDEFELDIEELSDRFNHPIYRIGSRSIRYD